MCPHPPKFITDPYPSIQPNRSGNRPYLGNNVSHYLCPFVNMAGDSQPANKWVQVTSLVAKDTVGAGTYCFLNRHLQRKKEAVINR